jgi:hypothetical protein
MTGCRIIAISDLHLSASTPRFMFIEVAGHSALDPATDGLVTFTRRLMPRYVTCLAANAPRLLTSPLTNSRRATQ